MITIDAGLQRELGKQGVTLVYAVEVASLVNASGVALVYSTSPISDTGKDCRPFLRPLKDNAASLSLSTLRASVSGMAFAVVDHQDEITDRLASFDFVGKVATIKVGTPGTAYADFITIYQGRIVNFGRTSDGAAYDFDTTDLSENLDQFVFRTARTKLTAEFGFNDEAMTVESTADFSTAGPFADHEPHAARGYVIVGSGSGAEIVRWFTKSGTQFTGLADGRGTLGSQRGSFSIGTEVRELVVWPGHPLEILAVLLTGSGLEETPSVPASWRMLDPVSLDSASWILAKDRTRHYLYEYRTTEKQFARNFAEIEVLRPLHLFIRSSVANTIAMASVTERPIPLSPARQWGKGSVRDNLSFEAGAERMSNQVRVEYDWDALTGAFLTSTTVNESSSQTRFGVRNPTTFALKGLRAGNGGADVAEFIAREHFLVYGFPRPDVGIALDGLAEIDVEVGDPARVTHPTLPAISEAAVGVSDRFMKVVQRQVNFASGEVRARLLDFDVPSGNQYASVAENGTPDFPSASEAQQAERVFLDRSVRGA